mmetsp:Transcript_66811/g.114807  ORF Transcript_66811/g.114807 Transcript_66811/m.114807 type:complete len:206 (-) Transcript_66811:439-1056(-)
MGACQRGLRLHAVDIVFGVQIPQHSCHNSVQKCNERPHRLWGLVVSRRKGYFGHFGFVWGHGSGCDDGCVLRCHVLSHRVLLDGLQRSEHRCVRAVHALRDREVRGQNQQVWHGVHEQLALDSALAARRGGAGRSRLCVREPPRHHQPRLSLGEFGGRVYGLPAEPGLPVVRVLHFRHHLRARGVSEQDPRVAAGGRALQSRHHV